MSAEATLTLIFSAVVAISTVVYAVLTWRLVQETRNMRAAQTDPSIGLHIEPSSSEGQLFMLVVQNHGMGPAYDVRFEADASQDAAERPLTFLRNASGLAYMAPGQKIVAFYGSAIDLLNRKDKGLAKIRVRYRRPSGTSTASEFTLDPGRFEGMPLIDSNHSRKLAESVDTIAKTLSQVVYWSRLQVTVQTKDEQGESEDEFRQHVRSKTRSEPDLPASQRPQSASEEADDECAPE